MSKSTGSQSMVIGATAIALCVWGGTPVANKVAVSTMNPLAVGVLRCLCAGLIAGALAFGLQFPFPRANKERALLFVSGFASFAIWPVLLSFGLRLTSANHAGLIIALIPVITGVLAACVERRWPTVQWWLGGTLAVAGATLLILSGNQTAGSPHTSIVGDLIVIAGAVACAVGYVAGGKLTPLIGTWATTFWGLTLASLTLIPVAALTGARTDWLTVGSQSWIALGYLAVFASLLGYLLWFWALGRGGIARVGTWQLLQPVVTVLLAGVLLGETLTPQFLVAASVIIIGTAIAQSRRRTSRSKTTIR